MAVIGSIRKRGGLLVVMVAGALALFVLQGLFSGNNQMTEEERNTVAKVEGETVSLNEYEAEFYEIVRRYELEREEALPSEMKLQYQNYAMDQLLDSKAMDLELEKLGITVTSEGRRSETRDMYDPDGVTVPDFVQQYFRGQDGTFDRELYAKQKAAIEAPISEKESYSQRLVKQQYQMYKESEIKYRARRKYMDFMVKSTYVPTFMAKRRFMEKNTKATFNLLYVPFTVIADSTIKDEELNLQEYLQKNKAQYISETDAVTIDMYAFRIIPSAEDTANLAAAVDTIFDNWKSATNDTAYLQEFADARRAVPTYKKYMQLPAVVRADSTYSPQLGEVEYGRVANFYEPEFFPRESAYHMYKVSEIKRDTVWEMEVSQIAFPNDPGFQSEVDGVIDTLEKGADFGAIATNKLRLYRNELGFFKKDYSQYVSDSGKIINLTDEAEMFNEDTEYRDKLFAIEDTGWIKEPITSGNLKYIVYVHKTKTFKSEQNLFLLSDLDKTLEASSETRNDLYSAAIDFQGRAETKEGFYKTLKEDSLLDQKINIRMDFGPIGYTRDPQTMQQLPTYGTEIQGVEDPNRKIFRWGWRNEVDAAPEFFQLPNAYVVAVISSKDKKGELRANAIENMQLRYKALQDKKAEIIIDQLSQINDGDIVDIAQKYNEKFSLTTKDQMAVKVWNKDHLLSNNMIDGEGKISGRLSEPGVVGKIFGLDPNGMARSEPFKGQRGVFIVEVLEKEVGEEDADADYSAEQEQILNEILGSNPQSGQTGTKVMSAAGQAVKYKTEIEDFRYNQF